MRNFNSTNQPRNIIHSWRDSENPVTSDTSVVDQRINVAERVPRLLHVTIHDGAIGGNVKLHGDGAEAPAAVCEGRRRRHRVDLVAEGAEAVDAASREDDAAAGAGQVEAEVAAEAGGGAGDHDDLSGKGAPGFKVVGKLGRHGEFVERWNEEKKGFYRKMEKVK